MIYIIVYVLVFSSLSHGEETKGVLRRGVKIHWYLLAAGSEREEKNLTTLKKKKAKSGSGEMNFFLSTSSPSLLDDNDTSRKEVLFFFFSVPPPLGFSSNVNFLTERSFPQQSPLSSPGLTPELDDCAGVGDNEDDEWDEEHEQQVEDGVELLLPLRGVGAVGHALVELLHEGTLVHAKDDQLEGEKKRLFCVNIDMEKLEITMSTRKGWYLSSVST